MRAVVDCKSLVATGMNVEDVPVAGELEVLVAVDISHVFD